MRIVYMNGGLGNQIFQYIFFRWLQKVTGDSCIVDDSAFFGGNVPHNGYELEHIFRVGIPRLSQRFEPDVWNFMIERREHGIGIAQQLNDAGMPLEVVREEAVKNIQFSGKVTVMDKSGSLPLVTFPNTYYHGYWIGSAYFVRISEQICQELVFPEIIDEKNQCLAERIQNSASVALHIRRGDMAALGGSAEPAFFARAIRYMEREIPDGQYFLFSDDLAWCRTHEEVLGLNLIRERLEYVEGNEGDTAFRDMQMIFLCQNCIGDRSTFSMLARMLRGDGHGINILKWDDC